MIFVSFDIINKSIVECNLHDFMYGGSIDERFNEEECTNDCGIYQTEAGWIILRKDFISTGYFSC